MDWAKYATGYDPELDAKVIELHEGMRPLRRKPLVAPNARLLDNGNDAGRGALVTITDEPKTLINLTSDDEFARVVTLTLVTVGLQGQLPGDPATAIIQYGVAGVQATAVVDFLQNTTLTLPCSFLRVSANRRTNPGSPAEATRLAAFVSYGSFIGGRPQRTQFRGRVC